MRHVRHMSWKCKLYISISDLPPLLSLTAALEAQNERVGSAHHLQLVLHLLIVFGLVHHLTAHQLHLQQRLKIRSTLETLQVTKIYIFIRNNLIPEMKNSSRGVLLVIYQ